MLKMKVLQFALYCCLINQLLWTEVSTKPVPAPEPFIDIIPLLLPFLITETIKLASDKSAREALKDRLDLLQSDVKSQTNTFLIQG